MNNGDIDVRIEGETAESEATYTNMDLIDKVDIPVLRVGDSQCEDNIAHSPSQYRKGRLDLAL